MILRNGKVHAIETDPTGLDDPRFNARQFRIACDRFMRSRGMFVARLVPPSRRRRAAQ